MACCLSISTESALTLPELAKYSSNCEFGLNQCESHSDTAPWASAERDPRERVVRLLICRAESLGVKAERVGPQSRVVVNLPDRDLYRCFWRNEVRTDLTGLGGLSNDETHDGR